MPVADSPFDLLNGFFSNQYPYELKCKIKCCAEALAGSYVAVSDEALSCQLCACHDSLKVRMACSLLAFEQSERGQQRRRRADRSQMFIHGSCSKLSALRNNQLICAKVFGYDDNKKPIRILLGYDNNDSIPVPVNFEGVSYIVACARVGSGSLIVYYKDRRRR